MPQILEDISAGGSAAVVVEVPLLEVTQMPSYLLEQE